MAAGMIGVASGDGASGSGGGSGSDTSSMHDFWDRDEVNLVAAMLPPRSLGAFACTAKCVADNLRSRDTLRFLADLRGVDDSLGISSIEHLEVAETMAQCQAAIFFGWGSMEVDEGAHASLTRLSSLLGRHPNLRLSIEAHCGLEARYAMPLPGQARDFTRSRAESVLDTLLDLARAAGHAADASGSLALAERVVTRAWGCSRPLVWCFGQPGMATPYDPDGAAKNRRVELYLRVGSFEVPRRRLRSEIPRPAGAPPLDDAYDAHGALLPDLDDGDGTADASPVPEDEVRNIT
jgi:hypothetical protein